MPERNASALGLLERLAMSAAVDIGGDYDAVLARMRAVLDSLDPERRRCLTETIELAAIEPPWLN